MKQLILAFALISPLIAQEVSPEVAQLRTQLRDTALLLRAAQTDKANAEATFAAEQAKTAALQEEIDSANAEIALLTKRASQDKLSSEEAIAKLNELVLQRESRIKEYATALAKWKLAHQRIATSLDKETSENSQLTSENTALKNTIADRERKNLKLYSTSLEVLNRYENYALGKALSAREPFVQKTRVEIENQVQSYMDVIVDQGISAQPKQ